MNTRNQLRRIGININQAARILNATDESPVWLEHALAITTRSMTTVDDAAAKIAALAHREAPQVIQARYPRVSR